MKKKILILGAGKEQAIAIKQAKNLNQFNVPSSAMWIQGIWASILCLSGKYGDLLVYSTFASLIFYVLTIFGILVALATSAMSIFTILKL